MKNKLEELIEKLCPNGVEYKELGLYCKILKGKQLNKEKLLESGKYPAYNGGIIHSGFTNDYNVKENTTIISQGGASAGFVQFIKTKFWANAHCYYLEPDTNILNNKYIYYFVKQNQNKLMKCQYGAGIPALKSNEIFNLLVPLPPLEIQEEIVRILDKFTEQTIKLTTELTTELTLRKQQYKHYRDKLLNKAKNIKMVTLDMISENYDSQRKPITSGNREKGNIPYYGASGIVDYINDYIFDGDYLLISEDGANLLTRVTPIAFSISGKAWVNNHAHVLKFSENITRKYVETYLNSIDLKLYITGAAQPKLNKKNLNSIKIPLPPLEEQKRIVEILDRFDKMINDIKEGLLAEIEMRQKQYEYYRDKLLNFN